MSDTEIWGPCGHEWINFGAWVTGGLDEREERAVEARFAACDTCWGRATVDHHNAGAAR